MCVCARAPVRVCVCIMQPVRECVSARSRIHSKRVHNPMRAGVRAAGISPCAGRYPRGTGVLLLPGPANRPPSAHRYYPPPVAAARDRPGTAYRHRSAVPPADRPSSPPPPHRTRAITAAHPLSDTSFRPRPWVPIRKARGDMSPYLENLQSSKKWFLKRKKLVSTYIINRTRIL